MTAPATLLTDQALDQTEQVYNGGDSIWAALVNRLIDGITSISKPQEFQAHMNDVDLWLLQTKRKLVYGLFGVFLVGLVCFAFAFAFGFLGPSLQNVALFTGGAGASAGIGAAAATINKT